MNSPNHLDRAPDRGKQLHDALLPLHDPTGVNEERVFHFAEAIGLPEVHHIILSPSHRDSVRRIAKQHRLRIKASEWDGAQGTYYEDYNLALTKKSDDSQVTELTAVHEAAHSHIAAPGYKSALLPFYQRLDWQSFKQEVIKGEVPADLSGQHFRGFRAGSRGSMTEEMWATLVQGAYNQVIMDQKHMKRFNFINAPPEVYPAKYQEHHVGRSYPLGALALEVLCDANPALLEPMFASRKNPERMHDVAQKIDTIEKGLFLKLHTAFLNRDAATWDYKKFHQAYLTVFSAVDVELNRAAINDRLEAVHSRGVVASYVSDLLADYGRQTGYTFVVDPPPVLTVK